MQRCHACQHELDDDALQAGRCPECGAGIPLIARRRVSDKTDRPPPGDDPAHQRTLPDEPGRVQATTRPDDQEGSPNDPDNKATADDIQSAGSGDTKADDAPPNKQGKKARTVDDRVDATVEFQGSASAPPSGEAPGRRPTMPMRGDFTIDFGGADPDLSRHMTSEWAAAVSPGLHQNQTLRQSGTVNESAAGKSRTSLPVKNRSVRQRSGDSGMTPLMPGDVPDYELLEMIGQGGMGVVYAAHQSSIARTVAVKMLKQGGRVGDEQRDKFISEAVVTGELDHPNIVPIYDMGANDEGALFYSMKRVKGTPWDEVLKDRSLDENLNILMRVADAVAFAHAGGVVHRDLKPENVMLGDYGEVLVMDWGLARVTTDFRNADAIYQPESLGGTPAYMAPEMARGPIDKIDGRSDVYLLGAILYEIIGGEPPHSGRDVMQCLMAAANNKIDPIEYRGELLDIALRAMATDPDDRYATVKDLQAAIREYQAHSESLVLATNAERHLEQAQRDGDYALYARALYGCQEALALWVGNRKAAELLERTQLGYAAAALDSGDFDLGLSLLAGDTPEQQTLRTQLQRAKRERQARVRRVRTLKQLVAAAAVVIIAGGAYSYMEIRKQRNAAVVAQKVAEDERTIAERERQAADRARQAAETAKAAEEVERAKADANAAEARRQEQVAITQQRKAEESAEEAKRQERIAVAAKEAEEYEAYVARIGVAAAKIEENAFDRAREVLEECPIELRNWEWGRLNYLCGLSPRSFAHDGPVDAVAFSPDGRLVAAGDWAGRLVVQDVATEQVMYNHEQGEYVHAVAYSPDGRLLASGSSDGSVRVMDASSGAVERTLEAHPGGVLSVAFSPNGRLLLTAGYDNRARLWDLASGDQLQTLRWHDWWVWSAQFSPDGRRIVTASQDGKVIVWRLNDAQTEYQRGAVFDRHDGPVYAATFSPDGRRVASAGYDGLVCVWSPEDVHPVSLRSRLEGEPDERLDYLRLAGHEAAVRDVAFSPDGGRLLSASYDNTLRLWDAESGETIKALRGHGSRVRACAFSPDGKWAASGSQDQQVRLWDIAGYEEARVLRGLAMNEHADAVLAANFSADGQRVITASRDRTARIWDADRGRVLQTFQEGHEFLASTAHLFDGGRRLATGAGDNTVRVWNVAAGAEQFVLRPTGRAAALAVSPDGQWLLTGGPQGEARFWRAREGAEPHVMSGHRQEVTAAAIRADSAMAATGDQTGQIRLWQRVDGDAWRPGPVLDGHSRMITGLAFTPNGGLVSASGDNTCGQWDTRTGEEKRSLVLRHPQWVSSLDVSSDGAQAITSCEDGRARVWRLADATVTAEFTAPGGALTSVSLSPRGEAALVASSADRKVYRWRWNAPDAGPQGAVETVIDMSKQGGSLWAASYAASADRAVTVGGNDAQLWDIRGEARLVQFSPHGAVAAAAISPDGRTAATGSWDNSVKLWDAETGKSLEKLEGVHTAPVNSVAFLPDSGELLLTGSDDGTAVIWSLSGAQEPRVVARHDGPVNQAVFSPDGSKVLTASSDKTARVWDRRTGEQLKEFVGHEWDVMCAAFSADGSRIATGGQDNTARLWDAATGEQILLLPGHTATVTSVAFSPDGSRVLTGSLDRTAKVWDAQTVPEDGVSKEVLTLEGHTGEVTSVAFSPSGRDALTASRDGAAILWLGGAWDEAPAESMSMARGR